MTVVAPALAPPPPPPPPVGAPPPPAPAGPGTAAVKPETGLGETRATFVDWLATNHPRLGICPGELAIIVLLVLLTMAYATFAFASRAGGGAPSFLSNFSITLVALATTGAAFETWRNLRQIERTDEGAMTPHLWLMGVKQHRVVTGSQEKATVTGLRELYVHNYGPGLAIDVRIIIDGKGVDRIAYMAPDRSIQIGGALHGHGMEGTLSIEVLYEASSGREHRLAGTLLRDRDMDELLFRPEKLNHIYTIA